MNLRFFAREGLLVTEPGAVRCVGQHLRYVGRVYDHATRQLVAAEVPSEYDPASGAGQRLIKITHRDRSLWPADEATAHACGVPFVPVVYTDGQWEPQPAKPAPTTTTTKSKGTQT